MTRFILILTLLSGAIGRGNANGRLTYLTPGFFMLSCYDTSLPNTTHCVFCIAEALDQEPTYWYRADF